MIATRSIFVLDMIRRISHNVNKQQTNRGQIMLRELYKEISRSPGSAVADVIGVLSIFVMLFVALHVPEAVFFE